MKIIILNGKLNLKNLLIQKVIFYMKLYNKNLKKL